MNNTKIIQKIKNSKFVTGNVFDNIEKNLNRFKSNVVIPEVNIPFATYDEIFKK